MVQSFRSEKAYTIDTSEVESTVWIFITRTGIKLIRNQIVGYLVVGKTLTFRIK